MLMGDLVLLPSEVGPVVDALQRGGIEQTALNFQATGAAAAARTCWPRSNRSCSRHGCAAGRARSCRTHCSDVPHRVDIPDARRRHGTHGDRPRPRLLRTPRRRSRGGEFLYALGDALRGAGFHLRGMAEIPLERAATATSPAAAGAAAPTKSRAAGAARR